MSTAWVEACGTAVAKYNQGAACRDVMEEAVSKFVNDGTRISAVPRITYVSASGRVTRQDLDVALRRHIVTQANQAKMRMVDARAAEFGHDLVWTSAHFGARPSHAEWQGQVFSRTGTSREYPPLVEATGYGTAGGLCGVNCRHTFAPYLPETKVPELPETMNGLTSEQHYQATQQQRAMEREISKLKQEIILGQQAGLPMTQARLELGHKQRQLKVHTDHYKLPRNYLRERAWGVEKQPMRLGAWGKSPALVKPLPKPRTISGSTLKRSMQDLHRVDKAAEQAGITTKIGNPFISGWRAAQRFLKDITKHIVRGIQWIARNVDVTGGISFIGSLVSAALLGDSALDIGFPLLFAGLASGRVPGKLPRRRKAKLPPIEQATYEEFWLEIRRPYLDLDEVPEKPIYSSAGLELD